MADKEKLQKILKALSNESSGLRGVFGSVQKELEKVADKLREEAETKTVQQAQKKFEEIRSMIAGCLSILDGLKEALKQSEADIANTLNEELDALKNAIANIRSSSGEQRQNLANEINLIKQNIKLISDRKVEIPDFKSQIEKAEKELRDFIQTVKDDEKNTLEKLAKKAEELDEDIQKIRTTMSNIVSRGENRGGSAHRQINVNSSVMSTRYADINFQQFGNIGWTAVNDDTYKRVNIRASILAGGGGGAGMNRSVSVISVSSTFAAAASTDYAAFPNVGIRITLPDAVGNSNLYTVKNMAASSVQVAAAAGQDIDGSATVLMPTQYESLTFLSNSSVWGVI